MSRLSYPRESSLYLEHLHLPCTQRSQGAAPSSHLASRLLAVFPEVGKPSKSGQRHRFSS